MIRSRLVGLVSAGALLALALSGAAQEVSMFGSGPDRVCNTLVDKTHKPVLQKGGAGSVLTAQTYGCPEAGLQPIAQIEPAAPAAVEPLPASGVIYFELDRANLDPRARPVSRRSSTTSKAASLAASPSPDTPTLPARPSTTCSCRSGAPTPWRPS